MFFVSLMLVLLGIFYFVFAFREPPKAVDHFFHIPAFFVFFPEQHRVRNGRIVVGAFFCLAGAVMMARELFQLVGWG